MLDPELDELCTNTIRFPTVDASANVFIADTYDNRIHRVAASTGVSSTVAGDRTSGLAGDGGPATSASLNRLIAVAVDAFGNLLIAYSSNNRIRKVEGIAAAAPTPTPTPTATPSPTATQTPTPAPAPTRVPSLNQWGLVAMAGLMAVVLVWRLRQTYGTSRRD